MNLQLLLGLFQGSNLYETLVKVITLIAGFIANIDGDKQGKDDLLAGALFSVAEGIDAYGKQDDNEHGNIVDGLIAGLTEYREQMVSLGKIFPVDHVARSKN